MLHGLEYDTPSAGRPHCALWQPQRGWRCRYLLCDLVQASHCSGWRAGFDLGFWADDKHYINNHLMFKILVYKTNGQYTKARKRYQDLEAAAVVEVAPPPPPPKHTSFPSPRH